MPTENPENIAPDAQYGRLPHEVVTSGALAGLGRSEWAVYSVIAAHIGDPTWSAFPSIKTIARCAGIHERTARRVVAKLAAYGLLTIEAGGGRGHSNTYTLNVNPDTIDAPLSTHKPGREDAPLSADKGGQSEAERGAEPDAKGDKSATKPGHLDAPPKAEKRKSRKAGPNAAAAGIVEEVVNALLREGIGKPKRDLLALTPGVSVELIQREAARLAGTNKGGGILIQNIEAAAARSIADGERRSQDQADTDAKRRATSEKLARRAAADASARELIETLSDDRVAELHSQGLAGCSEFKRESWRRLDPRKHPGLMREIARQARKAEVPT